MLGNKVRFYASRYPSVIKDGVILDKVLLKEIDHNVSVTGYIIESNSDLHIIKCYDLIKIL